MATGLSGAYRFVARLAGMSDLSTLGGTVTGVVTDPTHFVLEFPDSTFVTRYTRTGADAVAVVNGLEVQVATGTGTFASLSPEDMLPARLWDLAVAPWAVSLGPTGQAGAWAAPSDVLIALARVAGYSASDWHLSATTDASGRLTLLSFGGTKGDGTFRLDLGVVYG